MGRRRVEIKKIEDKARRQTTFTKRRDGLFKKTDQLCNMCDTEAAVITFSNGGNAFAFGNPSVDSVIDRYLTKTKAEGGDPVNELQHKLANAMARLEIEKKRGETIDRALARLNLQCKDKSTEKLQIGNKSHCQDEEMARLEAEKKRGEVTMLNPPVEALTLEEFQRRRKGKGKATVDEMTEFELRSGNKSLRRAMRREEALDRLEAEKNCREAIEKALETLNEQVEDSRLEEVDRQRKEMATVEEMTELQSGNQAEALALARLEAEKNGREAIDKALATLNEQVEDSRLEEVERQPKGNATVETVEEMTELQSGNQAETLALVRLEAEKNCREATDKALETLNEPVEDSRLEEVERQPKGNATVETVEEMTELQSDNQAEALALARLEAERKHDEAIDEMLAILHARLEALRREKCEQQRDVTMEDIEMTEPELRSANKG